jgi:hypothetical protein
VQTQNQYASQRLQYICVLFRSISRLEGALDEGAGDEH